MDKSVIRRIDQLEQEHQIRMNMTQNQRREVTYDMLVRYVPLIQELASEQEGRSVSVEEAETSLRYVLGLMRERRNG